MELFLAYRHYDGSTDAFTTGPVDNLTLHPSASSDMDVVMGGARIRF